MQLRFVFAVVALAAVLSVVAAEWEDKKKGSGSIRVEANNNVVENGGHGKHGSITSRQNSQVNAHRRSGRHSAVNVQQNSQIHRTAKGSKRRAEPTKDYESESVDRLNLGGLTKLLNLGLSGEEGSYPHLTSTAEAKLANLKPESVLLRGSKPVLSQASLPPSERRELDAELISWQTEMQLLERDLGDEVKSVTSAAAESLPRPAVRTTERNCTLATAAESRRQKNEKEKRLSSCDYAGWDRYDADTELNRIDLEEEQRRVKAVRLQQLKTTELADHRPEVVVDKGLLTSTEQQVLGKREREKGNEAFRAGDYVEALRLYSASIILDDDITTYNNRAITYIKLKNYEEALKDCNTVLRVDCMNLKALLRRGHALEQLRKNPEALEDYEEVLKMDPSNIIAISSVKRLRKESELNKIRLTIEEICDGN